MCKFSKRSLNNLIGIHPDLVKVMKEAIKDTPIDFVITEGVRTAKRQNEIFIAKKSKCDGYTKKSNHQIKADGFGHAVDLYPLPIQYSNAQPYIDLSKHIKATAKKLNIKLRWGGDFKNFIDRPHYELI